MVLRFFRFLLFLVLLGCSFLGFCLFFSARHPISLKWSQPILNHWLKKQAIQISFKDLTFSFQPQRGLILLESQGVQIASGEKDPLEVSLPFFRAHLLLTDLVQMAPPSFVLAKKPKISFPQSFLLGPSEGPFALPVFTKSFQGWHGEDGLVECRTHQGNFLLPLSLGIYNLGNHPGQYYFSLSSQPLSYAKARESMAKTSFYQGPGNLDLAALSPRHHLQLYGKISPLTLKFRENAQSPSIPFLSIPGLQGALSWSSLYPKAWAFSGELLSEKTMLHKNLWGKIKQPSSPLLKQLKLFQKLHLQFQRNQFSLCNFWKHGTPSKKYGIVLAPLHGQGHLTGTINQTIPFHIALNERLITAPSSITSPSPKSLSSRLDINANVPYFPLSFFKTLFPAKEGAAQWVQSNFKKGRLKTIDFSLDGTRHFVLDQPNTLTMKDFQTHHMTLTALLEGGSLSYLPSMPTINNLKGEIKWSKGSLLLSKIQGDFPHHKATDSSVTIRDALASPQLCLDINLQSDHLGKTMKILTHDLNLVPKSLGLDLAKTKGNLKGHLLLELPLGEETKAAPLTFTASGQAHGVETSFKNAQDFPIRSAGLDFTIDNKKLHLKSQGKTHDLNIGFQWDQAFSDPLASKGEFQVSGDLSEELPKIYKALKKPSLKGLLPKGLVKGKGVILPGANKQKLIRGEIDLSKSQWNVDLLSYLKEKGQPLEIDFSLEMDTGRGLQITFAKDSRLQGRLLGKWDKGGLHQALVTLKSGQNVLDGRYAKATKTITLLGRHLNLTSLLSKQTQQKYQKAIIVPKDPQSPLNKETFRYKDIKKVNAIRKNGKAFYLDEKRLVDPQGAPIKGPDRLADQRYQSILKTIAPPAFLSGHSLSCYLQDTRIFKETLEQLDARLTFTNDFQKNSTFPIRSARGKIIYSTLKNKQKDEKLVSSFLVDDKKILLDSPDLGAILKNLNLYQNLNGGALKIEGNVKDGVVETIKVQIDQFYLDIMALRFLSVLSPLFIFGGAFHEKGVSFEKMEGVLSYKNPPLLQVSALAQSLNFGANIEGDINLYTNELNVSGYQVPVYFLNKMVQKLPFISFVYSLFFHKNGGLFAKKISLSGKLHDPIYKEDALKMFKPEFIEKFFQNDKKTPKADPKKQDKAA